MTIKYRIDGKPEGKARPRFANGHAYTPGKTKDYERAIALGYKAAGGKKKGGYITVNVVACYKIPKSETKARREMMRSGILKPALKPDIDNVLKAVLDGFNGTAYGDDKQVIRIAGTKVYGDDPFLEIEVSTDE